MGACTFVTYSTGKTAKEAFNKAAEEARYEYGHGGYTGTIAEKDSFTMLPLPEGVKAFDHAEKLLDEGHPAVDSKWGPAGCFDLGPSKRDPNLRRYCFFGWASE